MDEAKAKTNKRKWNVTAKKATKNIDVELEVLKSKFDALVVWTYEWPAFTTWESALTKAFAKNCKTKLTGQGEKCVRSDIVLFFCLVLDEDSLLERENPENKPKPEATVWFAYVPDDKRGVIYDPNIEEFDETAVNVFQVSVAVYDGVIDDESYGIWSVLMHSTDQTLYYALSMQEENTVVDVVGKAVRSLNREYEARYNIQGVVMSYLDASDHYGPMTSVSESTLE
jgi:hypothetical protein